MTGTPNDKNEKSPELAEDDGDNQKHQNSDDGNSNQLIRSHPGKPLLVLVLTTRSGTVTWRLHYLRAIPRSVCTLLST